MIVDFVNAKPKNKRFCIVSKVENDFINPLFLELPTFINNPNDETDPYVVDINDIDVYTEDGYKIPNYLLGYMGEDQHITWNKLIHYRTDRYEYNNPHKDSYFSLIWEKGRPIEKHIFVIKPFFVEGGQYAPTTIGKPVELVLTFVPKVKLSEKLPIRLTVFNGNQETVVGDNNELLLLYLPFVLDKDLISVVDITDGGNPQPLKFTLIEYTTGVQIPKSYFLGIALPTIQPLTKRIIEVRYDPQPNSQLRQFMTEDEHTIYVRTFKTPDIPVDQQMNGLSYTAKDFQQGLGVHSQLLKELFNFQFDNANPNLNNEILKFTQTGYFISLFTIPVMLIKDGRFSTDTQYLDKDYHGIMLATPNYGIFNFTPFTSNLPQRLNLFINTFNHSHSYKTDTTYHYKHGFSYVATTIL